MGGVIIIISIVIPCLLVSKLSNTYMLLMIGATLWLGTIGFWTITRSCASTTRKA